MVAKLLALGEVIWDVFPDGPRFGGAPANFACAVAGLGSPGTRVALASAVGRDALGADAVRNLRARGVETGLIAESDRPTGRVDVTLDREGRASYTFLDDAAWDHVEWSDGLDSAARAAEVVCFGTLAQRSEISRGAIRKAIAAAPADCLKILDINLRPPYWSREVVLRSLPLANVLKLNDEELPILAGLLELGGSDEIVLRAILERYSYRATALTRGANGSLLLNARGERSELPAVAVTVVDTVGAGDSFAAALALGLSHGLPLARLHRWASEVSAFVCTQAGGTPLFPEHLRLPAGPKP